jgi:hypothetical protein
MSTQCMHDPMYGLDVATLPLHYSSMDSALAQRWYQDNDDNKIIRIFSYIVDHNNDGIYYMDLCITYHDGKYEVGMHNGTESFTTFVSFKDCMTVLKENIDHRRHMVEEDGYAEKVLYTSIHYLKSSDKGLYDIEIHSPQGWETHKNDIKRMILGLAL